ncbi:hypothetical protein GALMADRAFT_227351 [Galerina marginata CBS 339.88]|uniref:Uncharacterized protein n=1 Tax=Galerina marginata (strain CBS 339.88) TaxID=685588 RepID=A0A067T5H4_GALM3|nr:hypothetical protein GALMADRAFT_227351 [Galerina marginata CBS 339.88]
MYRRQAFRHLAFVAFVFALGFWQLDKILATALCRTNSLPALVKMATWAGVFPMTTVYIPSSMISTELHTLQLLTRKLPDSAEMMKNRLEIGKISVALEAIRNPESQRMREAIDKYTDDAKTMLRSLSKLDYASMLTNKTLARSLAGIIKALDGLPQGERRRQILRAVIRSRQNAIDAWVRGLEDELKELQVQTIGTLADLDACDLSLTQVVRNSRRTKGQQQESSTSEDIDNWESILFEGAHERIRPAALEAVNNLEALIRESSIARDVVRRLSIHVAKLLTGLEAAYQYPTQMLAIDMTSGKEVERVVDMLRKPGSDVEVGRISLQR